MENEQIFPFSSSAWNAAVTIICRGGILVVGVASIIAGLLYVKQDALLYFPEIGNIGRRTGQNPRRYRSPAEHNIPYETHMIRCEDGVSIHSWLLLHPNARQERLPTILFFHGNAGNIGLRLPNAIQMFHYLKANVLLVEYRGYGDSDDAKPSESGLKLDAEAALRFISEHPQIDAKRIFIFGRSLGGAVSFHLAQYAENNSIPVAGVIVENTFISIAKMVDHLMPLVAPLKPLVLRIGWDSGRAVTQIKTPVLYLAGSADQLVPHSHMQELFHRSEKASVSARMHIIKDGTHNETWLQGGKQYWHTIRGFFDEIFAAEKSGAFTRNPSISESTDVWNSYGSRSKVAVGMGMESENLKSSSIPTMPNNLIGMAKNASAASAPKETGKKEI
eukprot:CAMPEP_0113538576 /NCGR_PEP_ID=MMETSP0015_2-20120614/7440_1 /TAXON_ID=2838 /ORGANISM="Odontella" /LENGTH=389 /DNA_ID=CAMNT_0000438161 /DNA_START=47 /DNA_END=1216 /DNA_ORIENTATION=- /assembly_acc=CAM_ASM_000160